MTSSSPPTDKSYTNFNVTKHMVAQRGAFTQLTASSLTVRGGNAGDVLVNDGNGVAVWSQSPLDVETINVGVTPNGIAITSDSLTAYVANNNNYGTTAGQFISVVNLTTQLQQRIASDTFVQPYTVTLSPDNTLAYVTNSASPLTESDQGTISIIDTASNTVVNTISGFDGPSGLAITRDGSTGYVNNYGAAGGVQSGNGTTVSVVNLSTRTITATITVDQAPAALALSPDDLWLYVANYTTGLDGSGTVQVVSTASNAVVATITGFFGPFGIVVNASGTTAYVTNFGSNNFDPFGTTVSVVDLTTRTISATVDTLGIQPSGLDLSPDGRYLYVSNYNTLYQVGSPTFSGLTAGQGTVNIIDTETLSLLPITIAVGQSPAYIKVAPSGDRIYISNYTSGTLSVIRAYTA